MEKFKLSFSIKFLLLQIIAPTFSQGGRQFNIQNSKFNIVLDASKEK
jgi:hypothetical protein